MGEKEFAPANERLDELREQVHEGLTDGLGGDLGDSDADTYHVDEPMTDGVSE